MSKPVTTEAEHQLLSIFQYSRGREYAGNRFDISPRPERFKSYNGPCIRLKTKIRSKEGNSSMSGFIPGVEWLKQVLLPAFGVTAVKFHGHESELLWSFPSAGGSYPVELYVAVRRLSGIESGLYHYNALYASLYRVADGNAADQICHAMPAAGQGADVSFILTIVPWRSCWKYAHKGYRFAMVDAGHVAANLQLVLRSLGWRNEAYTRIRSDEFASELKLDDTEVPIAFIAASVEPETESMGQDAGSAMQTGSPVTERCESQDKEEASLFDWEPIIEFQQRVNRTASDQAEERTSSVSLPEDWRKYDELLPLLIQRRSSAAFERCELRREELNTMLAFIDQLGMLTSFHLIVHGVEGLTPGVYRYEEGDLACLSEGEYREASSEICLGQTFIRDSSVLFVFTIDMMNIPSDEFSRYQQSSIDGGAMGQLIHLKTEEMGLGFSIVGGFYDNELRDLLKLPHTNQIIYTGAWGRNHSGASEARKHDRYVMNKPQS